MQRQASCCLRPESALFQVKRRRRHSPVNLNVLDVYADREVRDSSDTSSRIDSATASLVPHDAHARTEEMTRVRVRLEAHEIAAEHAIQERFPSRQVAEIFGRREGAMEEE